MDQSPAFVLYEFGIFRLDTMRRTITRHGQLVALTPKAFDLLIFLVQNSGRVLTKDEIMSALWTESVVEESNLTQNIFLVRKALGDDGNGNVFIQTIPRHGYKFVALVNIIETSSSESNTRNAENCNDESDRQTTANGRNDIVSSRSGPDSAQVNLATSVAVGSEPVGLTSLRSWRAVIHKGTRQGLLGFAAMVLICPLVLASASYGIYAFLHRPLAVPFQSVNIVKLTESGNVTAAAISPDGKYVVHGISEDGKQSLWIRHIETNSSMQILPSSNMEYHELIFAPDGNYLYFLETDARHPGLTRLFKVAILGGTPTMVLDDVQSRITFSPDGRRFAFLRSSFFGSSAIMIANSDGGNVQKLIELSLPSIFGGNPAWSSDGKVISLMEIYGTHHVGHYVAVDVATGNRKEIATFTGVGLIQGAAWLPDASGLLVAFASQSTHYATQIGYIAYPSGQFRRITNDLNSYDSAINVTRDGKSIVTVAVELSNNIWVMPGSGDSSQAVQVSSGKIAARELGWTADERILSVSFSNRFELDVRANDGTKKAMLFSDMSSIISPSVCGDGRYIIFSSSHSGKGINLWRVDSDGGSLKQLTEGNYDSGECSPDGKWVIYGSLTGDQPAVWKIPIDGGMPVRLSSGAGFSPTISRDGSLVAYGKVEGKEPTLHNKIMIASSNDGKVLYSIDYNPRCRQVRFMPDSQSLACIMDQDGASNVWMQRFSATALMKLTGFKSDLIFDYAWSHDGKTLALLRGQESHDMVLLTSK